MTSNARSMIAWTSSGSSLSDIAAKPDTSENITVTIFRSPSMAPLEVRIFSARCLGVKASGDAKRLNVATGGAATAGADAPAAATAAPASRGPHSLQNLFVGALGRWQP